jgi:hypothetical protein
VVAVAATSSFDCNTCGACCVNLPSNRAEGFVAWVEIEPDDHILTRADLVKKLVHEIDGVPHLRLAPDGRCAALRGAVGRDTKCSIYRERPSPCRKVQPGDALCRRYRLEHSL